MSRCHQWLQRMESLHWSDWLTWAAFPELAFPRSKMNSRVLSVLGLASPMQRVLELQHWCLSNTEFTAASL